MQRSAPRCALDFNAGGAASSFVMLPWAAKNLSPEN
jgi:hypothetical protein